jgi:serine/threonine protein kinase
MIQIGKKIGDYLVRAELSQGGMGTLYYAIDTMLNREVTLKVIHPQFSKNSQLIAQFKNEAITQAQMNHPNIITLFSFIHIDENYIIVMEFIKGTDLHDLLKNKKMLPIEEALFFLKQILRGLNYAHEHQIIHGDIKPRNIMITNEKKVKISDFGIAKIFGLYSKIENDMILGTPTYTSPEQILGKELDFRSDLYSLGITFYEMVTGKVPFNSETESSINIEKAHLFDLPPKPSIYVPGIKNKLEIFMLKAIQKKPEKRYQSAIEMLEEVDKLIN